MQRSEVHRMFLRLQSEDAIRFVRPGDATGHEVPFPVPDMRDALSFFKLSIKLSQLDAGLIKDRTYMSELIFTPKLHLIIKISSRQSG